MILNSADAKPRRAKPLCCFPGYKEKAICVNSDSLDIVFLHPNKWKRCQQVSLFRRFSQLLPN